ncbi:MAG: hypothetical protein QJR14_05015 [Bacillota bacterium]|nr:hypothetical protein [Bacillota bacterium]
MSAENGLVFALAGLLAVWWVAGAWVNRRRAERVLAALRPELRELAGSATIRWHGGSAFRIDLEGVGSPFRAVAVLALLAGREAPLAILWTLWRRRGDQLVIEADLLRQPARELLLEGPEQLPGLPAGSVLELRRQHPHLHLAVPLEGPPEATVAAAFRNLRQRAAGLA